jgi:VanZ family protein
VGSGAQRTLWLWGPVALYMAAIFYVSAQPDVSIPSGLTDKSSHSIAYAGLGVLMTRALAGGLGVRVGVRAACLGALLTAVYGLTDELHQMFVPGRSADLYDVVADGIGGVIGAFVCWLWGIIAASRHGL